MSRTAEIPEEMLFAYVDGELDATAAARVEAALALEPLLAARVAEQRALRNRLREGFDPVALEPVPDHLLRAATTVPVADIGSARARRAAAENAHWKLREWGAMAATLVLGLIVGIGYQSRSNDQPLVTRDGNLLAAGFLSAALSEQLSGTTTGTAGARIGLSIHASNGEYCRSFTVPPATAGLACRRSGAWAVDLVTRGASTGPAEFRQAASSLPEVLRSVIEQRINGEPLTSAEEAVSMKADWRAYPVPAATP